jgi:hypothetical protein
MSRFEKIVGVGTIVIGSLSLPLSLPLAYDNLISPPPTAAEITDSLPASSNPYNVPTDAPSPSPTPDEGDTNTHVVRTERVLPDVPHYTIDSIARPSEREWADITVALVYDPETNVSIVYPHSLPLCDSDDGTAVSNHLLVAACKWDGGDDSFIVIAP